MSPEQRKTTLPEVASRLLAHARHLIGRATSHLLPSGKAIKIYRGPAAGLSMAGSYDEDLWIALGGYEPEIRRYVDLLGHADDTIVDIGAGRGYYTLAWAARGATVHAYEADRHRRRQIDAARSMNHLHDIHIHGDLRSLDDIRVEPTGLKVDIEGDETYMFDGQADQLEAWGYPWLIVELHTRHARRRVLDALPDAYETLIVYQGHGVWRAGDRNRDRCWLLATHGGPHA